MRREGRSRVWNLRLAVGPIAALLLAGCAPEAPRGLVLISMDTVRSDHLSTYGYDRPTSPALDRLAEHAVVFREAYTQEVNTAPSHASMFTGAYPHQHGCVSNYRKLGPAYPTLAEQLLAAGFRTAGFVSGFPMRARVTSLDRGFEVWDDGFRGLRRDGVDTTERALRWLGGLEPGEPFFLFLHLYDAHGPYHPPASTRELFRSAEPGPQLESIPEYQRVPDAEGRVERRLHDYVDRYDASIRHVDELLARVLEAVEGEEVVLAVLSDHGETLGERTWALDHGAQLFDEQMRIPFLLAAPGLAPGRVDARVETVDLLPTLLELLDLPASGSPPIPGKSLLPVLRGGGEGRALVHAAARAENDRWVERGYVLDPRRRLLAVRSGRWKLVRYPGVDADPRELYDLAADPGETRNVAEAHPEVVERLDEALRGWHEASSLEEAPEIPPDVREGLEALGYIE